jgi:hypothetical protein
MRMGNSVGVTECGNGLKWMRMGISVGVTECRNGPLDSIHRGQVAE